jgi:tripartite-type tricarboxylate transporter receptor subunit TctC
MKPFLPVLAGLLIAAAAQAQGPAGTYPDRPVTVLNPYSAGGQNDAITRALAANLQERFKQPFVVVSREGASGVVAMTALSRAAPDGLTLAYSVLTPLTIQPHLVPGLALGPASFAPVCGLTENILGIVVRADSPIRSVDDLLHRSEPAKVLNYASGGVNSAPSLGVEALARLHQLALTHVPLRGDSGALQELLGERVDFAAVVTASATPFVKSGRLRLLAVMAARRDPNFPAVPTLRELGQPVEQVAYAGLFAPRQTPAPILDALERACQDAARSEGLKQVAATLQTAIRYQSRSEFTRAVQAQFELQGRALKAQK